MGQDFLDKQYWVSQKHEMKFISYKTGQDFLNMHNKWMEGIIAV